MKIPKRAPKNVTDRILLRTIYELYQTDYNQPSEYQRERDYVSGPNKNRRKKNYVHFDCELIVKELLIRKGLFIDKDVLECRLFEHMNEKYKYPQSKRGTFLFSKIRAGLSSEVSVVDWSFLHSVLAELDSTHLKFIVPLVLGWLALLVSAATLYFKSC